MTGKWIKPYFVMLSLIIGMAGMNASIAQESADSLTGYWKQKSDSVYIQVVMSDGAYEAEMVRNDWAPGLVGSKYFYNVVAVEDKKNRWAGESKIEGSSRSGKATLRLRRSGELTSKHKPGGKAVWVRSEPVEKRR